MFSLAKINKITEKAVTFRNPHNGDKKITLTNAQFIDDPQVIDPDCDCTTCLAGYSCGFLCHQFKVKEPLAGALVSVHNIRYLQRICEEYQGQ